MRDKDFANLPGFEFPPENPEVVKERYYRNEARIEKANKLGVDLTLFDGGDTGVDGAVFKTQKEKNQYLSDVLMLSALLHDDKEIPEDLAERLLRVKYLREQAKRKGQEI